ncbi:hypothetical protein Pryu01_00451 [Paraliobacillus ryukyuensis]|uniref:Uncharacterized protein DUF4227 n=1 Tax=Paraliobacillus ryukyuensis TaxID=200904 RepID=A0A366EGF7_9BACI|nr:DUF4227 family protein [Paraliobacillus ryukyuensis]RBP01477.1 uncharacterized protein DUF4227 [Paraliobacillus ryukyuensis]
MRSFARYVKDVVKLFVLFVLCTSIFYFGLQAMHSEYQDYHRYDPPEGNAIKVSSNNIDYDWMDRLSILFRLGE